jgi:hypothetical protein
MKILFFLLLSMNTNHAFGGDMTQIDTNTFKGCEGEGCGCTHDKKSNKAFKLFEKMDKKSKLIGFYKKNTNAETISPFTILIKAGKAKITEVLEPASGLKVNDVLSPIFYEGEGSMKGMLGSKWISFDQSFVKLKTLEKQKSENWLELKVGDKHGYTPSFPFTNCL